MDSFKKDDIYNGNLSVEHVPPKSIMAVFKTITCTRCNNTIGHQVQGFMANDASRKELEAGRNLKKPLRAKVQLLGKGFNMKILSTDGRTWHAESPLSSLPPSLRSEEVRNNIIGTTAAVSLNGMGSKEALDRAYLHSSYLVLFSLLGYPYIMQPFMEEIRQQIIKGQAPIEARIAVPTKLRHSTPFIDPREKSVEVSLIGTAPDLEKSCFGLVIAGELVLMPLISDYYRVIHSEFNSMLSDPAANAKRHWPFDISLLEIDPSCKYSAGYMFEKGRRVGDQGTLRLSPVRGTNGT
jgi:hypothetical protein